MSARGASAGGAGGEVSDKIPVGSDIFQLFIGKRFLIFNSDHCAEVGSLLRALSIGSIIYNFFSGSVNRERGLKILLNSANNNQAMRELMSDPDSISLIDIVGTKAVGQRVIKNLGELIEYTQNDPQVLAALQQNWQYFLPNHSDVIFTDPKFDFHKISKKVFKVKDESDSVIVESKSNWNDKESAEILADLINITQPYGNFRKDNKECSYKEEKLRHPSGLVLYNSTKIYPYYDKIEGRTRIISLGQIYDRILFGIELQKLYVEEENYESVVDGFFSNCVFTEEVAEELKKSLKEERTKNILLNAEVQIRGIGWGSFTELCKAANAGRFPEVIAEAWGIDAKHVAIFENKIVIDEKLALPDALPFAIPGMKLVRLPKNVFEMRIDDVLLFEEVGLKQFQKWSRCNEKAQAVHFDDILGEEYERQKIIEDAKKIPKAPKTKSPEAILAEKKQKTAESLEELKKIFKTFEIGIGLSFPKSAQIIKGTKTEVIIAAAATEAYFNEMFARDEFSSILFDGKKLAIAARSVEEFADEVEKLKKFAEGYKKFKREFVTRPKEKIVVEASPATASSSSSISTEAEKRPKITEVEKPKSKGQLKKERAEKAAAMDVLKKQQEAERIERARVRKEAATDIQALVRGFRERKKFKEFKKNKKTAELNRRVNNLCNMVAEDSFYGEEHDRENFLNAALGTSLVLQKFTRHFCSCDGEVYLHGGMAYSWNPKDIDFEIVMADADFTGLACEIPNLGFERKEEISAIALEKFGHLIPEEFRDIAKAEVIFLKGSAAIISLKIGEMDITVTSESTREIAANWTNEIDARCFFYDKKNNELILDYKPGFPIEKPTTLNTNCRDFYLRSIYSAVMPSTFLGEHWPILEEAKESLKKDVLTKGVDGVFKNINKFKEYHKIGKRFPKEEEVFDYNLARVFEELLKEKIDFIKEDDKRILSEKFIPSGVARSSFFDLLQREDGKSK